MPDFTREAYRTLLQTLLARGYRVRRFQEAEPARPDLILRHDIDLSPEAALPIARIEAELGLRAVYFFLLDSPIYAPDAPESRSVYRELVAAGHEIGLHFDAARHPDDVAVLDREAAEACDRLAGLTGREVETISFHRPARALLGRSAAIGGRLHTYQPRFFSSMDYCSDSRGRWRYGHPCSRASVTAGRALQLLTHPIWWAHDDAGDREAAIGRLIAAKGKDIAAAVAETISGYDPVSGRIRDETAVTDA